MLEGVNALSCVYAVREACSMGRQDAQVRQVSMVTVTSKKVFPRSSGKVAKACGYNGLKRNVVEAYIFGGIGLRRDS